MYEAIHDFFQTLSADSPILWALFVLGVVATVSPGLYAFWEFVLKLVTTAPFRTKKRL